MSNGILAQEHAVRVGDGGTASLRPLASAVADLTVRITACLWDGPGLAVLRGLPLDGRSDEECAELCRWVSALVGKPRPRGSAAPMDHLLTTAAVSPVGQSSRADVAHGMVKEGALAVHTDRAGPPAQPALLGLLCIRPALRGGESLLISGHAAHDRLLTRRPAVMSWLYQDFHFGAEPDLTRTRPVFRRRNGRLQVHYNRRQIGLGHSAANIPLSAEQTEALDALDEILADESMVLRLSLRRGDLLLLNNSMVLHGRTAYVESRDPLMRRCLARVWAD